MTKHTNRKKLLSALLALLLVFSLFPVSAETTENGESTAASAELESGNTPPVRSIRL